MQPSLHSTPKSTTIHQNTILLSSSMFQTSPSSKKQSQTYYPQPPKQSLLHKYRKCKINANLTLSEKYQQYKMDFISGILCKLFKNNDNSQHMKSSAFDKKQQLKEDQVQQNCKDVKDKIYARCLCDKIQYKQRNYCTLAINWIDQQYYWRTDKQFLQVYQHYTRKNDQYLYDLSYFKLTQKIKILGLHMTRKKLTHLAQVLSNYLKHLKYYNKFDILAKQTDTYVWVCLGILYHINCNQNIVSHTQQEHLNDSLIFWSIDITMNLFNNLTKQALLHHTQQVLKYFKYYFPRWYTFFNQKITTKIFEEIIYEMISEMMFGYMGIQSIGFFLQSFQKYGWHYLYKIILSYFDFRLNTLKNLQIFLSGAISTEMLIEKLIDSCEQWPMVFCQASAFKFPQDKKTK